MITFDICDSTADWLPGEYIFGEDYTITDEYMEERWKPIPGVQGYYISDHGRVFSSVSDNFIYGNKNKNGYTDFSFKCNGKRDRRYLHRLIAESFIPNPNNCPLVRHLDDNPLYNDIDNLEWGDQFDNMHDAIRNGHFKFLTDNHREKAMVIRRMPIVCTDVKTNKKRYFKSQQEASRELGVSQQQISHAVNGKVRIVRGYVFEKNQEGET